MPKYEVDISGSKYEIDAPNEVLLNEQIRKLYEHQLMAKPEINSAAGPINYPSEEPSMLDTAQGIKVDPYKSDATKVLDKFPWLRYIPNVDTAEGLTNQLGDPNKSIANKFRDLNLNGIPVGGNAVTPALTAILGAMGGATGVASNPIPGAGLAGTLAGGMAGSAAGQSLQTMAPEMFGTPDAKTLGDVGPSILKDAGINAAFNIPTVLRDMISGNSGLPFKTKLARLLTGNNKSQAINSNVPEEFKSYIQNNPEFPVRLADTTGNPAAKVISDITAPFNSRKIINEQQNYLQSDFTKKISDLTPITSLEGRAIQFKDFTRAGYEDLKGQVKAKDTIVKNIGELNATRPRLNESGQPISNGVSGPIYLSRSKDEMRRYMESIKDFSMNTVAEADKPYYKKVIDIMGTNGPISISEALELKSVLGSKGFQHTFPNRVEGKTQGLWKLVDEDIKNSVGNWRNGSAEALKALEKRNSLTVRYKTSFEELPVVSDLLAGKINTIKYFQSLKDPQEIDLLFKGLRPDDREPARKLLAANYLSDIFESAYKSEGKVSRNIPKDSFATYTTSPFVKKVFSTEERSAIGDLFSTIQHVDPNASMQGLTALGIRAASASLYLTPAIVGMAVGAKTDLPTGAQSALALGGALIGLNKFSKAVLNNPKVAKIAADLMKLPPESPAAKRLSKELFIGLKGLQVTLLAPNGTELGEGTINNGRINMPQFSEADPGISVK